MLHKTSKYIRLFSLPLLLTGSFNSFAVEAYKTVDENGAVVFSDKKTQGAETIKVEPNVVDLNIPVMPESSTQTKPNKQVSSNPKSVQQDTSGWNTANGRNLHRRVRTETNGEGVSRHKSSTPPGGGSSGGRAGGR